MRNIYWHFFTKTPFQLKSGLLFLLLVISGLVFRQNLSAQTNDTIVTESANHQIWIDIYPHYFVNEKLEYYGDAGFRTIIDEVFRNRGRAGLGLGYNASKDWRISFTFNWQSSRTGPEDELNISDYAYQLKVRKLWKSKLLNL